MWAWLEPHDQFRKRINKKVEMHSHLHTKDNVGKLQQVPGQAGTFSAVVVSPEHDIVDCGAD